MSLITEQKWIINYLQVSEQSIEVQSDGLGVVVFVGLDGLNTSILEDVGMVSPSGVREVDFLSWEETVDEISSNTKSSSSRKGLDSGDLFNNN